ncbi:hypothetical protein [Deinococcus roseus]|uniref:hypothetical protein n=1 Tax=Deinococcus roseus TaxID=392414 RepID=UPI00166B320F|nr:hypothetical protein [Deinococcus roseus]
MGKTALHRCKISVKHDQVMLMACGTDDMSQGVVGQYNHGFNPWTVFLVFASGAHNFHITVAIFAFTKRAGEPESKCQNPIRLCQWQKRNFSVPVEFSMKKGIWTKKEMKENQAFWT